MRTYDNKTRKAVLSSIVAYKQEHDGISPSMREIMEATGLSSTSVVSYHLDQLEKAGQIKRMIGENRGIQVSGGQWKYLGG